MKAPISAKIALTTLAACLLTLPLQLVSNSWCAAAPIKAAAKMKVWNLRQRCQASGSCIVRLCPTAVRIDPIDQDFSVISRAPRWTVYAYSKSCRCYASWPQKEYGGLRKDVLFGSWLQERQWMTVGRGKHQATGLPIEQMRIVQEKGVDYSAAEKVAIMSVAPSIPCSLDAIRIYARTIKVPPSKNLPLEGHIPRSIFGLSGGGAYLSTTSAHEETVDSSIFDLPAGFKQVADDTKVTGDKGDNGFSELLPDGSHQR